MAYYAKKEKGPDYEAELKTLLKAPDASDGTSPLHGAWLLCGVESYLSSHYRNLIRKKVIPDPDMGYFDHIRLSGAERGEMSLGARISMACEGLPMMNPSKLIEIEAPSFSAMRERESEFREFLSAIEALEDYPYITLLIVCAEEEFDTTTYKIREKEFWKTLQSSGLRIVSFDYQSTQKLSAWCQRHFASEGITCTPYLVNELLLHVGSSMASLSGEMKKLCDYLHANGRDAVTSEDIVFVCAKNDTSESFGISNAICNRDIRALAREYRIAKQNRVDARALFYGIAYPIADLYRVKVGLSEGYTKEELARLYFKNGDYKTRVNIAGSRNYSLATLKRLHSACQKADVALKSTPADGYVLLDRLIASMTKIYELSVAETEEKERSGT